MKEKQPADESAKGHAWFLDAARRGWDRFTFQSSLGSIGVKLLTALVVFCSLYVSVSFGMAHDGSLIREGVDFLAAYTADTALIVIGLEVLVALLWLVAPSVSVILSAGLLYVSYAGLAPVALLFAFSLLILFMLEERPVLALLIALPAILFLTPFGIGLGVVVLAAFLSTRGNNGWVRAMGFLYYAWLALSAGSFGVYRSAAGEQILPAAADGKSVREKLSSCFASLNEVGKADDNFVKILLLLVIFLLVGIAFAKITDARYPTNPSDAEDALDVPGRMPIDVKDALLFLAFAALVCVVQFVLTHFEIAPAFPFSHPSILSQTAAVYVLTRLTAGKSPKKGKLFLTDERPYLFISYSHADLDRIRPYLRYLRQNGYEFWYDDSIKTGTEWQGVIASNLTNCSCFLAFISYSSIRSEYCLKEFNYAAAKDKPMAVILLDDVDLPPVLEMHFASLQAVQRSKFDSTEACMQKVAEMEQLRACKFR